jgi:hypothetical protein
MPFARFVHRYKVREREREREREGTPINRNNFDENSFPSSFHTQLVHRI